jgi:hypothetical protein
VRRRTGETPAGRRNANATPAHDDDHASPPVRTPLSVVEDDTDAIILVVSLPRTHLNTLLNPVANSA